MPLVDSQTGVCAVSSTPLLIALATNKGDIFCPKMFHVKHLQYKSYRICTCCILLIFMNCVVSVTAIHCSKVTAVMFFPSLINRVTVYFATSTRYSGHFFDCPSLSDFVCHDLDNPQKSPSRGGLPAKIQHPQYP